MAFPCCDFSPSCSQETGRGGSPWPGSCEWESRLGETAACWVGPEGGGAHLSKFCIYLHLRPGSSSRLQSRSVVPLGGELKSMFVSESLPALVSKGLTSGTILSDTERISGCACCGEGCWGKLVGWVAQWKSRVWSLLSESSIQSYMQDASGHSRWITSTSPCDAGIYHPSLQMRKQTWGLQSLTQMHIYNGSNDHSLSGSLQGPVPNFCILTLYSFS